MKKYALRKHKSVGAASVVIGLMFLGSPVYAQTNMVQSDRQENVPRETIGIDEQENVPRETTGIDEQETVPRETIEHETENVDRVAQETDVHGNVPRETTGIDEQETVPRETIEHETENVDRVAQETDVHGNVPRETIEHETENVPRETIEDMVYNLTVESNKSADVSDAIREVTRDQVVPSVSKNEYIENDRHTADHLFTVQDSVNLTNEERVIYNNLKTEFNNLPQPIRQIVNAITIYRGKDGRLGYAYSRGARVFLNAEYWHPENGSGDEIATMLHEIGHTVDGRSVKDGLFEPSVDQSYYSYSRDKDVQDLLQTRYKGAIYYEAWASLFAEYINIKNQVMSSDTPLNKRILIYGDDVLTGLTSPANPKSIINTALQSAKERGVITVFNGNLHYVATDETVYDLAKRVNTINLLSSKLLDDASKGERVFYRTATLDISNVTLLKKHGDGVTKELETKEIEMSHVKQHGDGLTRETLPSLEYGTSGESVSRVALPSLEYGTSGESVSRGAQPTLAYSRSGDGVTRDTLPVLKYGMSGVGLVRETLPILEYGTSGESVSLETSHLKYGVSGDGLVRETLPGLNYGKLLKDITLELPILKYGTSGESVSRVVLPLLKYGTSGEELSQGVLPVLNYGTSGEELSQGVLPVLNYGTSGESITHSLPVFKNNELAKNETEHSSKRTETISDSKIVSRETIVQSNLPNTASTESLLITTSLLSLLGGTLIKSKTNSKSKD